MESKYLLKDALISYERLNLGYKLPICLGIDEKGKEYFADLTDLKHILMSGSTGSGKSVFNHNVICSFITRYSPDELKLYLIDPKIVEFPVTYKGLPHLISPVDVSPENCLAGLERIVLEKNRRLKKGLESPYWIVVIDTFSDLAFYNPTRFERIIQDLTVDATKAGVYVIMCDSRHSADVFTEAVKNCFSTKIAFHTTSPEDSTVIIGQAGAEKLLGQGDMLLLNKGQYPPVHLQAPYISDNEIKDIVGTMRSRYVS